MEKVVIVSEQRAFFLLDDVFRGQTAIGKTYILFVLTKTSIVPPRMMLVGKGGATCWENNSTFSANNTQPKIGTMDPCSNKGLGGN